MCRGRPSMLTGAGPTPRCQSRHSVVVRSRRCPTTPFWRRSAPISPARPGTARAIARGHVSPSAARGVALRHDHGSAFLAEHFHNQIRFWGMTHSYAFVGEPETNGVIERFFRTLKEQIVHGRIYQTIDEVCGVVRDFIARYNAEWLIEKNGLRSPSDARAAWYQAVIKAAASASAPRSCGKANSSRFDCSSAKNRPQYAAAALPIAFSVASSPPLNRGASAFFFFT